MAHEHYQEMKLKKIPVREPAEGLDVPSTEYSKALYPPSFHIDERQMPEIEDWPVKGKYRLLVEIEMIDKHSRKKGDKTVGTTVNFDITKYKYFKQKSIDKMNDKEFGEYQGQALAGNVSV